MRWPIVTLGCAVLLCYTRSLSNQLINPPYEQTNIPIQIKELEQIKTKSSIQPIRQLGNSNKFAKTRKAYL